MEDKRSPYALAFKALAILALIGVFLFLIASPTQKNNQFADGLGEVMREGMTQVQKDMMRPLGQPKKESKKEATR